jgi:hypothetical protein
MIECELAAEAELVAGLDSIDGGTGTAPAGASLERERVPEVRDLPLGA